jgi:hypothetical protein
VGPLALLLKTFPFGEYMSGSPACAILFLLWLCPPSGADSLAQEPEAHGSHKLGTIAGRITINDLPAAGVQVVLSDYSLYPQHEILARTTTDKDGRYRLTELPSMRYWLRVLTPLDYIRPLDFGEPSTRVSVPEGESVENVDLALIRGGAISGRVVDADGRAVVGQDVFLFFAGEYRPDSHPYSIYGVRVPTDSTGAYKISRIPPGRYLAGIGIDVALVTGAYWTQYDGWQHTGRVEGDSCFARTFYPGVTNPAEATPVVVGSGVEARGININAARPLKTYAVSGRIIDAESRNPVGDCSVGLGHKWATGSLSGGPVGRTQSDGSFRMSGLLPGGFMIGASGECGWDRYTKTVEFDVSEGDVTGLEIEALRGTSLSGRVVLGDGGGPEAVEKLARIRLSSTIATSEPGNYRCDRRETSLGKGGSFIIDGLPPGNAMISLAAAPVVEEFSIIRVDHPNAKDPSTISISQGGAITGAQVLVRYKSGVVRGRMKLTGGKLAHDAVIMARISGKCDGDGFNLSTVTDPNGNFVFRSLPPGTHSVYLTLDGINPVSEMKSVAVENYAEADIEFILDVGELNKNKDN